MSKKKIFCYQVKKKYLKLRNTVNNKKEKCVYALLEQFGFDPIFAEEKNGDELIRYWDKSWGKAFLLPYDSNVGKFMMREIQNMYNKCLDDVSGSSQKWLTELDKEGFKFDKDGKLIENDVVKQPVDAQLVVYADGDYKGMLNLNIGGNVEFADCESLKDIEDFLKPLLEQGIIYKRVFRG